MNCVALQLPVRHRGAGKSCFSAVIYNTMMDVSPLQSSLIDSSVFLCHQRHAQQRVIWILRHEDAKQISNFGNDFCVLIVTSFSSGINPAGQMLQ